MKRIVRTGIGHQSTDEKEWNVWEKVCGENGEIVVTDEWYGRDGEELLSLEVNNQADGTVFFLIFVKFQSRQSRESLFIFLCNSVMNITKLDLIVDHNVPKSPMLSGVPHLVQMCHHDLTGGCTIWRLWSARGWYLSYLPLSPDAYARQHNIKRRSSISGLGDF